MQHRDSLLSTHWLCAAGFALAAACGGAQEKPAETAPDRTKTAVDPAEERAEAIGESPAPKPSADAGVAAVQAASNPAADAGQAAVYAEIGVPACDEYVAAVTRCMETKMSPQEAQQMRETFAGLIEDWKELVENPDAHAMLVETCKGAMEAAKQVLASYDCEW